MPDNHNKVYFISHLDLEKLIGALSRHSRVFVPVSKEKEGGAKDYLYKQWSEKAPFEFNEYRLVEPLKVFFTRPLEEVAHYFGKERGMQDVGKAVVFGVKNCDLHAHKIQDYVYLEGVGVDPLYRLRRENTVLIAGDCTSFKEVCFCLGMDIPAYPCEGFDMSLSPLNDGYLAEVGSKKGEEIVSGHREFFSEAKETQILARKTKRDNLAEKLKKHILPQDLPAPGELQKLVRDGFDSKVWDNFMLTCVECGGCNLICDTCHCFLLSEAKEGARNVRLRQWDSCQYANFARVAGGANPLKLRAHRLRNRFIKKFDFFVDNLKIPACCGCGRCIEVCPGKIDIRQVLKDLALKSKV